MLKIDRSIHPDDFVGTVRRTIRKAIRCQLTGETRERALQNSRRIKGGIHVRIAPRAATAVLRHANGGVIIPVDDRDNLVVV